MKNYFLSTLVFLMIVFPVLAAAENILLPQQRDGNVQMEENIHYGTLSLKKFTLNCSARNLRLILDGRIVLDQPIQANTAYTINEKARRNFVLQVEGLDGTLPKIDLDYSLDLFEIKEESYGQYSLESQINKGQLEVKNFESPLSWSQVTITVDDVLIFEDAVQAGQEYDLACLAQRNIKVQCSGNRMSEKDNQTYFSFDYNYSPFSFLSLSDRQAVHLKMEVDTDADGNATITNHAFTSERDSVVCGFRWKPIANVKGNFFTFASFDIDNGTSTESFPIMQKGRLWKFDEITLLKGEHTITVSAQGGPANGRVCFILFCKMNNGE